MNGAGASSIKGTDGKILAVDQITVPKKTESFIKAVQRQIPDRP
jgi:hypothetical protein